MSENELSPSSPGSSPKQIKQRADMARALNEAGFDGVQVVTRETAKFLLTPKRLELLDTIREEDVSSVRELAELVGRDKGQVSRDLADLAERGIITYEEDGRSKRPVLVQKNIVVEPI